MTVKLLSAVMGLLAFAVIIWMVRRDKLVSKDAAAWIVIAFSVVVLGVFPEITDWFGAMLNIGYPPVLPLIASILILLIKMVKTDIDKAHLKADIERLLQHQALLQAEIKELRDKGSEG